VTPWNGISLTVGGDQVGLESKIYLPCRYLSHAPDDMRSRRGSQDTMHTEANIEACEA
jgi:hypothetical protein